MPLCIPRARLSPFFPITILLVTLACSEQTGPSDSVPPVPGRDGLIRFEYPTDTSVTLVWTQGTDDMTAQPGLQYKVCSSQKPDITTVEEAESNGTVLLDWSTAAFTVTDTIPAGQTAYRYYNVLVRDAGGNTTPYNMLSWRIPPGAVFWPINTSVRRAELNGTGNTVAFINGGFAGLHVHPSEPLIFLTTGTKIVRIGVDGTGQRDVLTAPCFGKIRIDPVCEKMFWLDEHTRALYSADLEGSVLDTLFSSFDCPGSLAVDSSAGMIYISDGGDIYPRILRMNTDGTGYEIFVYDPTGCPLDLAVDEINGRLYWSESNPPSINRINLDKSSREAIITTGIQTITGLALDIPGHKLYIMDGTRGYVMRSELDGTDLEVLIGGPAGSGKCVSLYLR